MKNPLGKQGCTSKFHMPKDAPSTQPTRQNSSSDDTAFYENEPTVLQVLKDLTPTAAGTFRYLKGLFPCIEWIPRYNFRWLIGDCIAGLTVGLVVIPQAMAYAVLATLTPDFGLYTSFAGAATYWLLELQGTL